MKSGCVNHTDGKSHAKHYKTNTCYLLEGFCFDFFCSICLIILFYGTFLFLRSFDYILWFLHLCLYGISVCVNVYVSAYICLFFPLKKTFTFARLVVPSYWVFFFILFCIYFPLPFSLKMPACFIINVSPGKV